MARGGESPFTSQNYRFSCPPVNKGVLLGPITMDCHEPLAIVGLKRL